MQRTVFIVIKISPTVQDDGHRTMKKWRDARGNTNPVQDSAFGNEGNNNGATGAGLPGMQLQIPVQRLYHLLAVPPDIVVATIDMDLFYVPGQSRELMEVDGFFSSIFYHNHQTELCKHRSHASPFQRPASTVSFV
jgi:hypothetical protein